MAPPVAYVMNLDRSPERMARMSRLLDHLGIQFVRVPAIDGRQLEPPPGMVAGYYGNFLSHVKCWEMVVAGDDPAALILEDDVVFAQNFPALWADERLHGIGDIVRLEASNKVTVGRKRAQLAGGYGVHPLLSQGIGTAAYIVSKAGARWLLENANPTKNIDLIMFGELLGRGMEVMTLVPSPCIQHILCEGTDDLALATTFEPTSDMPKPLRVLPSSQVAALKVRQAFNVALFGQAQVRPTLHPSGPLVV